MADVTAHGVEAFAVAAERLTDAASLDDRLGALVGALAAGTGAHATVLRLADPATGRFVARAVVSQSPALAAELEGSSLPAGVQEGEFTDLATLPPALRRAAERAGVDAALVVAITAGDARIGTVELLRKGTAFSEPDRVLARVAATQAVLVAGGDAREPRRGAPAGLLDTAGEALAGGAEGSRVEAAVVRLAARGSGARAAVLWELGDNGAPPRPLASFGLPRDAAAALTPPERPAPGDHRVVFAGGRSGAVTVRIDESPSVLLHLLFDEPPPAGTLGALEAFAGRARRALDAGRRSERTRAELERTRALLGVVGQAIAELSVAHTLETAVARVAELLGTDQVAVYLLEDGALQSAAARGVGGPHTEVGAALLERALGPLRARGALVVEDASRDPGLVGVRNAVAAAGVEAAVAVPLVVLDDAIGLLVAYLARGRVPSDDETGLLIALAAQLGVAVQNARLHEEAQRLGAERARALEAERQAARRLRAFYEVSQSFTESMSLPETLNAVARTAVELLNADAAVVRTLDTRRDVLEPQAMHVADERLDAVARAMLDRPQSLATDASQRLIARRRPVVLTPPLARELGSVFELLAPFLERGGTAVVVPVASGGELIAALTVISLDSERALDEGSLGAAASLAAHAALAVDNARLYQQQKHFLESMQQALLPQSLPDVEGLDVARAYESSARLEVGGDVFDFLVLDDGRLAVVLGDVTGHGVDAAADMAMAKFVFRSLAREHPEPGDFLAAANDVVGGEIALGKFITMVVVTLDGATGRLLCAAAGHPPPRLVRSEGVQPLEARGVALGIATGERYDEVAATLAPGDAVVLYTDGVIEARRGQELYGVERLDAVLAAHAGAPAAEVAAAVLEGCRAFAGGELQDDCAVVVLRRHP
ncbi:MAG TPA: GAF domain-containing SpoIIE family protein phosphatase [Gaiellaceae bacterium]|nr:GAF domain-containing SpoIIE family protein phosphatase [Gaiellaceae bacterium]